MDRTSRLEEPIQTNEATSIAASLPDTTRASLVSTAPAVPAKDSEPVYARYTDDPEVGYGDPGIMLQTQRRMMDGSCTFSLAQKAMLSSSIFPRLSYPFP
jgi:hypothetical protein